MKNIISQQRRCGILAHISSLPSRYGIGDIGPASISFLDFLADAGQSCWQFRPLSPTSPAFDNSPYMSSSAFAGSPLLISPDLLVNEGLIEQQSLEALPEFSTQLYSSIILVIFSRQRYATVKFSVMIPRIVTPFICSA